VIAWYRKSFRLFWTWKVRHGSPGRPGVAKDVRDLIRKMSRENPLWGAPRIHGELLKLGIDISETSVGTWRATARRRHNVADLPEQPRNIASVDFFTVPTIGSGPLRFGARNRRRILHFGVRSPNGGMDRAATAEAFRGHAPRHLLRDRDRIFGDDFTRQVRTWRAGAARDHSGNARMSSA
jgi:hypothetical protein